MRRAYGLAPGDLINLSALDDYDESRNGQRPANDAEASLALLVFPAAKSPKGLTL
jgi:hypothetical protein